MPREKLIKQSLIESRKILFKRCLNIVISVQQFMKIDFKKTLGSYHAKHNQFSIVTIPKLQYLMIDGHGDPNTSKEFVDALEALYPVAYKLKFVSKLDLGRDYVVPPLEGLWWAENMETFTSFRDKSQWNWTVMIMVPDWITKDMFKAATEKVSTKRAPRGLNKVRFEEYDEGLSVQTLHIGSFDEEGPLLEKLHHEFLPNNGLAMIKKHHEIYLSDRRKVTSDRLRTILRQPVSKVS